MKIKKCDIIAITIFLGFGAFVILAHGCAQWPDCNLNYPQESKLRQIADDKEVCLVDVGNSLIVVNSLAVGFDWWDVNDSIKSVEGAIDLVNQPGGVVENVFYNYITKNLTKFPGLIDVSIGYISVFNSNKFMGIEDSTILSNYMSNKVLPPLIRARDARKKTLPE